MTAKKLFIVVNSVRNYQSKRVLLAEKAREQGYTVHIVTPDDSEIEITDFEHHTFPLDRRGMNPIDEIQSIKSLINLYQKYNPDIVHHFTIKPVLYGGIAARVTSTPAVVHGITGLGRAFIDESIKGKAIRTVVKGGYRGIKNHPNNTYIFQNPDDREYFISSNLVNESDTRLIRSSGVKINRFTPTEEISGPPLTVLPARMLWDKGIQEFVDAAKEVHKKNIEARFALVGSSDPGNPSSISEEILNQWDSDGVIEYWGWQDNMLDVYKKAHIVCLPSYREGVPQVLLEGAACSKPLVTTDVPGCREAVIDGENGYIVPPKDATQLADRLTKLITNPDLRQSMGQQGRTLVENEFSREVVVDRTIDVYKELI